MAQISDGTKLLFLFLSAQKRENIQKEERGWTVFRRLSFSNLFEDQCGSYDKHLVILEWSNEIYMVFYYPTCKLQVQEKNLK